MSSANTQPADATALPEFDRDEVRFSVIVCSHQVDRYPFVEECIESLLDQVTLPHEIVVVSDGDPALTAAVRSDYGDEPIVRVHELAVNQGLLPARNHGADQATGDVVAFIDDDAHASPYWLAELARLYREHDALAAGGPLAPDLQADRPRWLPSEFDWIIGATHDGFADETGVSEVRNTFGSNLSFRRDVFDELGGFATGDGYGREGDKQLQAGETELCVRFREAFGSGVTYSPEAVVYHQIDETRLDPVWALKRAFWQGYSKHVMEDEHGEEATDEEGDYLRMLLGESIPSRAAELVSIPVLTASVAGGYAYGLFRQMLG